MADVMVGPADVNYAGIPGPMVMLVLLVLSLGFFSYIIFKRLKLLQRGRPDPRFMDLGLRVKDLIWYGLLQARQPRYLFAGILHIVIFWGFIILGLRSITLVGIGFKTGFTLPGMGGYVGIAYDLLKDVFEIAVFVACSIAVFRRAVIKPERYKSPEGEGHKFEAYFVLSLIMFLMITDLSYDGSGILLGRDREIFLPGAEIASMFLAGAGTPALKSIYIVSYWLHIITFLFFLNYLPVSKHFHIITALPNLFFRKLKRGSLKPASCVTDDIEELESIGVGKFEDFTWKHLLDFYTCTECGRCSDNCPAYAVGRPLSPKLFTVKIRDHGYGKFPLFRNNNQMAKEDKDGEGGSLVGPVIEDDVVWSCTTCGACEAECPVFIEYIDKMIDLRRHLVENGEIPRGFQRPLLNFEKTGNPFGKPRKKRAEWIKNLSEDFPVNVLDDGNDVELLYFVDSYASYDPRIQEIAAAIVKGLTKAGVSFGILGERENDSGHQVRRIGEEGLFRILMEENIEAMAQLKYREIITTDPHAFNTIKNDYPGSLKVKHYSQYFYPLLKSNRIKPVNSLDSTKVYTYHDPCYLGRHNGVYDEPRQLLKALPGVKYVEMKKSDDRSFCCGGGDINLWYEVEGETMRMAEMRLKMVEEAGADVLVTCCPFCLLNFEDAIKTGGFEGKIEVVDLMELIVKTL